MTKLAPEWVRTSDPVIRSPARYRWTTVPALARLLNDAGDQFAIHSPCRMANSKRNPNLQEG